jgi:uncharacterized membrane protein
MNLVHLNILFLKGNSVISSYIVIVSASGVIKIVVIVVIVVIMVHYIYNRTSTHRAWSTFRPAPANNAAKTTE